MRVPFIVYDDDDIAQIFIDILEKNIKEIL